MRRDRGSIFVVATFVGCALALVWLRGRYLGDALFWDENCYVGQARFIAAHGFDAAAYAALRYVRPPLYAALLALVAARWPAIASLRVVTFSFGLLLLPLSYLLARQIGCGRRSACGAVVLVALTPLYVAQVGLVETDLPLAVLSTAALVALLDGRRWWFVAVAVAAAWVKESAVFLAAPAAWLLGSRGNWRAVWPAAAPLAAVALWLVVHRWLTGAFVHEEHLSAVGPRYLWESLNHQFVEDGRLPLTVLAAVAWRHRREALDARATTTIAIAVMALPVVFCAPLPRYMMAGLPPLAALAAAGLSRITWPTRGAVFAAVAVWLVICWFLPSWHTSGGHHIDANLRYRSLLVAQSEAAAAIARRHPRRVLASFPMFFALTNGVQDGGPTDPVRTDNVGSPSTKELCAYDVVADADQGVSLAGPLSRLRAVGALSTPDRFGAPGYEVRVFRIDCVVR